MKMWSAALVLGLSGWVFAQNFSCVIELRKEARVGFWRKKVTTPAVELRFDTAGMGRKLPEYPLAARMVSEFLSANILPILPSPDRLPSKRAISRFSFDETDILPNPREDFWVSMVSGSAYRDDRKIAVEVTLNLVPALTEGLSQYWLVIVEPKVVDKSEPRGLFFSPPLVYFMSREGISGEYKLVSSRMDFPRHTNEFSGAVDPTSRHISFPEFSLELDVSGSGPMNLLHELLNNQKEVPGLALKDLTNKGYQLAKRWGTRTMPREMDSINATHVLPVPPERRGVTFSLKMGDEFERVFELWTHHDGGALLRGFKEIKVVEGEGRTQHVFCEVRFYPTVDLRSRKIPGQSPF